MILAYLMLFGIQRSRGSSHLALIQPFVSTHKLEITVYANFILENNYICFILMENNKNILIKIQQHLEKDE